MTGEAPICMECLHFHKNIMAGFYCDAFPKGIPEAIIENEIIHKKPIEGDNGIQFEELKGGRV